MTKAEEEALSILKELIRGGKINCSVKNVRRRFYKRGKGQWSYEYTYKTLEQLLRNGKIRSEIIRRRSGSKIKFYIPYPDQQSLAELLQGL